MTNLLKKLEFLTSRKYYPWIILIVIFSLLVYPPSVSVGRSQKTKIPDIVAPTLKASILKGNVRKNKKIIDSLQSEIKKTDSLLKKNYLILEKQQKLIKKQK